MTTFYCLSLSPSKDKQPKNSPSSPMDELTMGHGTSLSPSLFTSNSYTFTYKTKTKLLPFSNPHFPFLMKYPKRERLLLFSFSYFLLLLPTLASSACECEAELEERDKTASLKLKFIAIASILTAGAVGVVIPVLGKWVPALSPEKDAFFLIKSFAAGVILATALIHILPDAFESLTSPCLEEDPWRKFPFAGFVSMMSALVTLMIDTVATSYYKRRHFSKPRPVDDDGDEEDAHVGHVHVHTHAGHGHSHGALPAPEDEARMAESLRHRVVSQVLELGIVVHSVIIGISLGASQSPPTIKPLIAALSFHQFFEGMGLGSCIVQANFKARAMVIMALFFSLTTPVGIGFGIAVSSSYNADSTTSLIVEGIFNAASAGILIYMSLVDLLAADFMSDKVQTSGKLQFWAYVALLLGSGFMSVIAKWN